MNGSLASILHGTVTGRLNAAQGNSLEVLHGHVVENAVGVLDSHHVVIAALGIDPVTGGDHAVRSHGGNHVVHHVLGREPDQAGFLAVDVQLNPREVQILGDVDAAHVRHYFDLLGETSGQSVGSMHVHRANLNIDRSRQTLRSE